MPDGLLLPLFALLPILPSSAFPVPPFTFSPPSRLSSGFASYPALGLLDCRRLSLLWNPFSSTRIFSPVAPSINLQGFGSFFLLLVLSRFRRQPDNHFLLSRNQFLVAALLRFLLCFVPLRQRSALWRDRVTPFLLVHCGPPSLNRD